MANGEAAATVPALYEMTLPGMVDRATQTLLAARDDAAILDAVHVRTWEPATLASVKDEMRAWNAYAENGGAVRNLIADAIEARLEARKALLGWTHHDDANRILSEFDVTGIDFQPKETHAIVPYNLNEWPLQTRHDRADWIDQDELSDALVETAYSWVPRLFPQAKRDDEGHYRCASIDGRPPRKHGSCVIYVHGEHAGGWHDFDPTVSPNGGGPLSTVKEKTGYSDDQLFVYARELAGGAVRQKIIKRPLRDDSGEINTNLRMCKGIVGTIVEAYFQARKIALPSPRSQLGFL